jgi:hypothetical protein
VGYEELIMCADEDCPFSKECGRHYDSGTRAGCSQRWAQFEKIGSPVRPENCKGYMRLTGGPYMNSL